MELWRIVVRALAAYVYLLVMTRMSGKRVVGEATPFDFVVALIVGDVIDDALWAEVSMAKFAGACGSLFLCDIITKLVAFHSRPFFLLVHGRPRVILRNGAADGRGLRAEQLTEGDLAHLLRLEGVDDWRDVRVAMLEEDHGLSVLKCDGAEPVQKKDAPRVRKMLRWRAS
ncbi:MAG TPA: YetF domain-containing protein [Thermoanaerobaculia bacterium]